MRFQFYVKVYHHKSFTSSNLLFQLEDRVSRKRHFTAVMGQVGSQKSNGTVYRILRKEILQSESLVRIRTSRSLPWRVSCTPLSACLFRVPRRGAVQIAHTSVSPVWYLGVSSFHFCFMFYIFFCFCFLMKRE